MPDRREVKRSPIHLEILLFHHRVAVIPNISAVIHSRNASFVAGALSFPLGAQRGVFQSWREPDPRHDPIQACDIETRRGSDIARPPLPKKPTISHQGL
jgi:hypothetical protein